MTTFEFFSTEEFVQSLQSLDESCQQKVREKLKFFVQSENPIFFARKLRGYKDIFRFRIGDYRVIFRLEKKNIILLLAKHRKDVYKGL